MYRCALPEGPVRSACQPGGQVHQVRAAHVEHRRNQKRQLRPLCLTLVRQPILEFRTDAVRNFLDAGHDVFPGSAKGGVLESHIDSSRQQSSFKTDRWQGFLLCASILTGCAETPTAPVLQAAQTPLMLGESSADRVV